MTTTSTTTITLKQLTDLSKINILQRKYYMVLEFLKLCGNKYDGIKVAGIIDVNKVYETNNISDNIVHGYNKLVMRIFSDLERIISWFIELVPKTQMKMCR
jgi:hypothetical protein